MAYATLEIKQLAIRLFKSGKYTQAEISQIVGYSIPAIKIWIARDRKGQPLVSEKRGHNPRKLNDSDRQMIRQFIAQKPDATIEDVRKAFNCKASRAAVHREMVRLGFSFKKRDTPTSKKEKTCNLHEWNGLTGCRLAGQISLFSLMKQLQRPI